MYFPNQFLGLDFFCHLLQQDGSSNETFILSFIAQPLGPKAFIVLFFPDLITDKIEKSDIRSINDLKSMFMNTELMVLSH